MNDYFYNITGKRIYVAGHNGMVGRAVVKRLAREDCEVVTVDRKTLDLCDQSAVNYWFSHNKPDCVINAAARVGGISDNDSFPADFIVDNILMQTHMIKAAHENEVERFVALGSSCIYPKNADNPIKETALMTGALETTNEAYAIAKIAGIQAVRAYRKQHQRDYIALMPCNLYGAHDRFDLTRGHVMAALMMKAYDAAHNNKEFVVWGTGRPRREFLHVDDAADGIVHALRYYNDDIALNMGSGFDLSITELAKKITDIAEYTGNIVYNSSKPDGAFSKLMDSTHINALGWFPKINLDEGMRATYQWYIENVAK